MPQPSHAPGRPARARQVPTTLTLEPLEDRTLLSVASPLIDLSGLAVGHAFDPNHILVRFRPDAFAHGTPAPAPGTAVGSPLPLVPGLYDVSLSAGVSVAGALAAYRADPRVLLAQPDFRLAASAVPNDARFADQWDMAAIRAPAAWDVARGNGVLVAVMDSGIDYNHPDLYQNVWLNDAEIPLSRRANLRDVDGDGLITFRDLNNPVNQGPYKITDVNGDGRIDAADVLAPMARDASGRDTGWGGWAFPGNTLDGDSAHPNDFVGWNFHDNNNNPLDQFGHGTHVAGTIGAVGDNGIGVAGVAWDVRLMPVKFLGADGSGTISQFILGLNYAVRHGARISNNSWTGAGNDFALQQAIAAARARGQVFVAAAGNDANNNDANPTYPASFRLDNVVSVAATDRNGQLASFSNYGATSVDLAAPGVGILSTIRGGGYGLDSGTSMATPHVTGALALVWGLHPGWSYTQVIRQVLGTVDRLPGLEGKVATGGQLDLAAALGGGLSGSAAPHVIASSPIRPAPGALSGVRLTFDRAINPSTFTPADVRLTGPGGRVIPVASVRVVAGTRNRAFDVLFARQGAAGTYTLRVGPYVKDYAGNLMTPFQGHYAITAAPPPAPAPAPHVVGSSPIRPAPGALSGVRLTFDRAINPSTFTPADVRLVGPGGRVIPVSSVRVVAGTNDHAFEVLFARQGAAGTYTLRVGPAVKDFRGVQMAVFQGSYAVAAPAPAPAPHVIRSSPIRPSPGALSGVRLSFDRAMNPGTFTGADVRLVGPGGRVIPVSSVRVVAGTNDHAFEVLFARQGAAGTYTLHVGPNVKDSTGHLMTVFQGSYTVTAPAPAPHVIGSSPIRSGAGALSGVRLSFDRAMNPGTFTGADVRLVGPGGRVIAISAVRLVAGTNDHAFNVLFAPQSAAGTYTLHVGPNVRDSGGALMTVFQGSYTVTAPAPAPAPRVVASTPIGPNPGLLAGVRLTFDRAINPSTFTPADVHLLGPGGRVIPVSSVRLVAGMGNRAFDVFFATQTRPGGYTLRVGPNVKGTGGTPMAVFQATLTVQGPVTFSSSAPVTIARWGRPVSLLRVNENVPVGDLNVRLNVTFPHDGDLYIHLEAPDGTNVVLADRVGGSGANFTNTVFDDQAALWISGGRAPFTGSFKPSALLRAFAGRNARGVWKLWVENRSGTHAGKLNSWSLLVRRPVTAAAHLAAAAEAGPATPAEPPATPAPASQPAPDAKNPFSLASFLNAICTALGWGKKRDSA